MSQIITRLDASHSQVVEADLFTRIMAGQFHDDEEVRYDKPDSYVSAYAFVGIASNGSDISAPVWSVVRRSYDDRGKAFRDQIRLNIAWTERFNGWT